LPIGVRAADRITVLGIGGFGLPVADEGDEV
jgi:hypothetical protein